MSRRVRFHLRTGLHAKITNLLVRAAMISRYSAICEYFTRTTISTATTTSRRQHECNILIRSTNQNFANKRPASYILRRSFHYAPVLFVNSESGRDHPSSQNSSQKKDEKTKDRAEELSRPPPDSPPPQARVDLQNYSHFFRQLAQSVPHIHRPTKDDFLKLTSSFWHRLQIRFKWLTIRSFRKFNADDLSAFFSFALVGQTLWILIGTSAYNFF